MTNEHLRPLLDDARERKLLFEVGEQLARAAVPPEVIEMIRGGRLTVLSKPDVVGDIVRRLVSRTIAQQLATTVEKATAPHQYALSTRAGCECIAHALQGLTELNPEATVTSVDGIGDLISRELMMTGLRDVTGGGEVLPFVRMFYGFPFEYLWEDDAGDVHKIPQGEGGDQGDPLMPSRFGGHSHGDGGQFFMVTMPQDVVAADAIMQEKLVHSCIRVHVGKTKVQNRAGIKPLTCDRQSSAPAASGGKPRHQGSWYSPWTPGFRGETFAEGGKNSKFIWNTILSISDVQSAWLLLLYCASTRANFQLCVVRLSAVEEFARAHDAGLWQCLSSILHIDPLVRSRLVWSPMWTFGPAQTVLNRI